MPQDVHQATDHWLPMLLRCRLVHQHDQVGEAGEAAPRSRLGHPGPKRPEPRPKLNPNPNPNPRAPPRHGSEHLVSAKIRSRTSIHTVQPTSAGPRALPLHHHQHRHHRRSHRPSLATRDSFGNLKKFFDDPPDATPFVMIFVIGNLIQLCSSLFLSGPVAYGKKLVSKEVHVPPRAAPYTATRRTLHRHAPHPTPPRTLHRHAPRRVAMRRTASHRVALPATDVPTRHRPLVRSSARTLFRSYAQPPPFGVPPSLARRRSAARSSRTSSP